MDDNFKKDTTKEDAEDNKNKSSENSQNTKHEEHKIEDEAQFLDFYMQLRIKIDRQLKDRFNTQSPINQLINLLVVLPDLLHLNIKLLFDVAIKPDKKGAIVGAILYVISPIDLIPDVLPAFGWLDDLIVITMALNALLDDSKDEYLKNAVQKYWAGDKPVLDILRHIIAVGDNAVDFLPRKLMKIVKDLLRGK